MVLSRLEVSLVDHCLVPGSARRLVVSPREGGVYYGSERAVRGIVFVLQPRETRYEVARWLKSYVSREITSRVTNLVTEERR
jgi:hypothetical protein